MKEQHQKESLLGGIRRHPVLVRLLLAVGLPVMALLLTETALRLAGTGYPVQFFLPASNGPGVVPNDAFGRRFRCPEQPVPFFLPAQKPPGAARVFVLGESAAAGAPDPAFNVSRMLQVMLDDQFPGASIEVYNAAMMGINSHAIRCIARECAAHGADVLVIYAGNNELIGTHGVNSPGARLSPGISLAFMRAGLWIRTTRLGQWLDRWTGERAAAAHREEIQNTAFFLAHRVAVADHRRLTIAENFRGNLDNICALASAPAGPHVVLATVAVNLCDCPPFGSLHRRDLSSLDSNLWETTYQEGVVALADAQWPAAFRHLTAAAATDDQPAELHYRLGQCALALSNMVAARTAFRLACDNDALPFRADTRLNNIIRETAAAHPRVTLSDVERAFEAEAQGLPGAEFFYDHVHFRFHGNYTLAKNLLPAVAAAVGARLGRAPRTPAAPPAEAECARRLAYTAWDAIKLQRAIAVMRAQHAFDGQMDGPARVALAAAELRRMEGAFTAAERQRTLAVYAAAIRGAPRDGLLRNNLAELLMELGQQRAAATQWQWLVDQFPQHLVFRLYLAMSLINAGDRVAAAQQLQEILRVEPDHQAARKLLPLTGITAPMTPPSPEIINENL